MALHRSILLLFFLPWLYACQHLPTTVDDALRTNPQDPGIVSGLLDNGMHYYLRSTNGAERDDLIEVRLVVRAGAIHETPSEAGYSHLLEHVVFRGTERFPINSIERLLAQYGLVWGRDVNATTHYGVTTYRFSLSEFEQEILPEILKLYADFLSGVQLDHRSIEFEKRIVEAEWMYRYGHRGFVVDPISAAVFRGTELDGLAPAGSLKTIRGATRDNLRAYWSRRYNPENAALIITGSIVPWELEPVVVDNFNTLKNRSTPGVSLPIESSLQPGVQSTAVVYADPDAVVSEVALNFVSDRHSAVSTTKPGQRFLDTLLFSSVARLMDNTMQSSDCGAAKFTLLPLDSGQVVYRISSLAGNNRYLHCIGELERALHRVTQFKITGAEFEMLRSHYRELAITEGNHYRAGTADVLADRITNAYIYNAPVLPAALYETQLLQAIDQMSISDFNHFRHNIRKHFQYIRSAIGPTGNNLPSQAALTNAANKPWLTPSVFDTIPVNSSAMNPPIPSERIQHGSEKTTLSNTPGRTEWRLASGGRVVFVKDARYDYIAVAMVATGGYQHADARISTLAQALPEAISRGVVKTDLPGDTGDSQSVESAVFVNPSNHGVLAYGSSGDINELFTRIGDHFRIPVLSRHANSFFNAYVGLNKHQRRAFAGAQTTHNEISTGQIHHVYRRLFWSPADFTTVIVGNSTGAEIESALEKINFSVTGGFSQSIKVSSVPVANPEEELAVHNRVEVDWIHHCRAAESINTDAHLRLISHVLQKRLRLLLREESGLSYEPEVELLIDTARSDSRQHKIRYTVQAGDVKESRDIVESVLDAIGTHGITSEEFKDALTRENRMQRELGHDYVARALAIAHQVKRGGNAATEPASLSHSTANRLSMCFSSENAVEFRQGHNTGKTDIVSSYP